MFSSRYSHVAVLVNCNQYIIVDVLFPMNRHLFYIIICALCSLFTSVIRAESGDMFFQVYEYVT